MPIFSAKQLADEGQPWALVQTPSDADRPADAPAPGIYDTLNAAFVQDNSVVGTADWVGRQQKRSDAVRLGGGYDPNFDFVAYAKARGMDKYVGEFTTAGNAADAEVIAQGIQAEQQRQDTLSRAGFGGIVAQLTAGAADPVNLIPFADALKVAKAGEGILATAGRAALDNTAAASLSEGLAQQQQATRTPEDAFWDISGAAVFGGAFGGTLGALHAKLGPKGVDDLRQGITEQFRDAVAPMEWQGGGNLSSASARRTSTLDQEAVAPAFGLEKLQAKNPIADDPMARLRASPNVEARRVVGEIAETPVMLKGNREGMDTPPAAESFIKGWTQGQYPLTLKEIRAAYARYAERVQGDRGKLSEREFFEAMDDAGRNGDVHEIPEVAEASKIARERLIDPLGKDAKDLGVIPEDAEVTTAKSYWPRLYDKDLIANDRNGFIKRLADYWETEQLRSEDKVSRAELEGQAEDVADGILGASDVRLPYDLTVKGRGAMKERTLLVPDYVVQPYLVRDAERVLHTYTRTMAADVELTRVDGEGPDLKNLLDRVNARYDELARKTPDGPEQAKLLKTHRKNIQDIETIRDRLRGTYGIPDNPMGIGVRTLRAVRNLNVFTRLGGMTIAALPDPGSILMTHGLTRTLGGLTDSLLTNVEGFKFAADEVKLAGTANDLAMHSRFNDINDVFTDVSRYSKAEQGIEWMAKKTGFVSGMDLWNSHVKQVAGMVTMTRMLQAIDKWGGDITPAEKARLHHQGVGDYAERIRAQFRKHGQKIKGVWIAGTGAWTDREAVRAFRAGLVKEVDRIIVTPGQEKPVWTSSELGKTIGQFKSFMFSSYNRTLVFGLQQRDANTLQGLIAMTSMGMLSVYLKAKLSGQPLPASGAQWISAGVDAAGVASWIFEANNVAQKTTGVGLPVAPQRYASRSGIESLLGPTAGTVNDVITISRDAAGSAKKAVGLAGPNTPQITASDIHRGRKLVPFNNLFYLRWLFDHAEHKVDDAAGLPQRKP